MQLEQAQAIMAASDEALHAVQTQAFDLIFSAIAMPGADGYQLVEKLQLLPQTADVPVIAITGYSRPKGAGSYSTPASPATSANRS